MYDIIIIGMGISGISAAIYAKRAGKNVLLIDKAMPGGLLNNIEKVSNYPGLINIAGPDFASSLFEQIKDLEIPYKLEEVIELDLQKDKKKVITKKEEYETSKVILAMGRKPKYLGLDKESDYLGRGISTCAICDGFFYKDAPIAIVGAGNSALQEAMYLSNTASKIYLLNRKDSFRADQYLVDEVKKNSKIEILYNVNITDFVEEDNKIKSVILDNGKSLDVKGVFIYIGYRPATEFIDKSILDENGYVKVDDNFETPIENVYAIGDVIKKDVYQLITAASDGVLVISRMKNK